MARLRIQGSFEPSLGEVYESVDLRRPARGWKRFAAFAGPAYMVSVGYMDPGNWATDLQAGSQFGYSLLWVLLMSNMMALLLQSLAARMGIVARKDLAQANRDMYPPAVNFCLWVLAELAIAATDLAEVLGMALGLYLLTGLPLIYGICITVLDTFLFLLLQRYGIRKMEAFIIALVASIGLSFLIEIVLARPQFSQVVTGLIPGKLGPQALYIAIAMIGATVMPHNLYLHSSLVQSRKIPPTTAGIKQALKYNFFDSAIALNMAFLVNSAILILAASVFFTSGNTQVARIEDAHHLLDKLLGTRLAPVLFALALIAAGQSSTITGTLAGQIVMEGYLSLRLNPILRRLITRLLAIGPAVLVILIYGTSEVENLLIFSQVILSLQLGFAIVPLIHYVRRKDKMGEFAIGLKTEITAWIVAAILVALNVKLVSDSLLNFLQGESSFWLKAAASGTALFFAGLLVTTLVYPWLKSRVPVTSTLHTPVPDALKLEVKAVTRIAIALDFSIMDEKILAHALQQGGAGGKYLLMHVLETAATRFLGPAADDAEAREDLRRLNVYAADLRSRGYDVTVMLGYNRRVSELLRLAVDFRAQLLVIGGHGHRGIFDFMYGETVDQLRHKIGIPVLIVV